MSAHASFSASVSKREEVVSFLGMELYPKTLEELTSLVQLAISLGRKTLIANHNLHSLYLFHRDRELRDFYRRSQWTHIDGMPLVAIAKFYGYRLRREHRVTYADWTGPLMATAAREGWRVFYLGSAPGVADRGAEILADHYPELNIRARHGFFSIATDSAENNEVLQSIAEFKPHLLLVGMGMPRQELWIHRNFDRICANVILPSGAAMDYIAGAIPTPPRWAGNLGLEWAFRLAAEPRRLFGRYLVEPWFIAVWLIRDLLRRFFRPNYPRTLEE